MSLRVEVGVVLVVLVHVTHLVIERGESLLLQLLDQLLPLPWVSIIVWIMILLVLLLRVLESLLLLVLLLLLVKR